MNALLKPYYIFKYTYFSVLEYGKLPEYLKAFPDLYEVIEYPGKGTVKIIAFKVK